MAHGTWMIQQAYRLPPIAALGLFHPAGPLKLPATTLPKGLSLEPEPEP